VAISEFYEKTIESVRVSLCFHGFRCDPDHITAVLGIEPDQVQRAGEERETLGGHRVKDRANQWALDSRSASKDVNVQIRDLLVRVEACATSIDPEWDPFFNVVWKGNYLYAGSGPFYERDVLAGVAGIGAEIFQDIYQVDGEEDAHSETAE
jgi:hypothetical protein